LVFRNSEEENGRPMASETKPARKPEAALCVLREFFRRFEDLLERYKGDAIEGTEL
jgi:hypothetical protein